MRKNTKTKALCLLLALVMVLGLLPGTALAAEEEIVSISTAEELAAFRDRVNSGEKNLNAKLTGDIQLTGAWTPFNPSSGYVTEAFAGTFDGGGHTVSGLFIEDSSSNGVGLFGTVNSATIRNLSVEGTVTASGSQFVGGIIGKTAGNVTIENCSFSGSVNSSKSGGTAGAGGIVGRVNAGTVTITGCANSSNVSGGCAAGILGYCTSTNNTIENCYNTGTISGANRTGGIAGQVSSTTRITNCYTVKGPVCGFNGNLANCYGESNPPADASQLGDAFTTDPQGNIILTWQAGGTAEPPKPAIKIESSNGATLWAEPGGDHKTETVLCVSCKNMDPAPDTVTWSINNTEAASGRESEKNADFIITANQGGVAVVSAKVVYQEETYTAEYKITVIPWFTAVEIKNTNPDYPVAIGQTVRATMYVQGGAAFDPGRYEGLTLDYQWYRRPSGGAAVPILGAVQDTYEIPDSFAEFDKIGIEIKCNGTVVHAQKDHQKDVQSAAYGVLYPVANDPDLPFPAELKTDALPDFPSTHVVNGTTAEVAWGIRGAEYSFEKYNEEQLAALLVRPESGTKDVKLTAQFTYQDAFINRDFTVRLWSDAALGIPSQELQSAKDALGQWYKLYPVYGTDVNVTDMVQADLAEKGFKGISVSMKKAEAVNGTDDGTSGIAENGGITYFYADPNGMRGAWSGSYCVDFALTKGADSLALEDIPVTVYWDVGRAEGVMRDEILSKVTLDTAAPVTEDLSLPRAVDGKTWALISWTSSDENAISISSKNQSTADTLFAPFVGEVKRGETDRQVILTAKFTFQRTNDTNGGREKPIVLYKTFRVTVKALEAAQEEQIRSDLLAKLEAGFEKAGLTDAVTGEKLTPDENGVYTAVNDIQFPTTRDLGVDGKYYPVTITASGSEALKAPDVNNAARVEVCRPGPSQKDAEGTITVTLHDRDTSVTASRTFQIKAPALTQEEIDRELALMERVKAAYFDGLKGSNTAKDNVRTDLTPFFEVYEQNGELVWVRENAKRTGQGIVPVPIEGWEDLELWRLFKSSNPNVISHEDLLVTRQTEAKAVTITSRLSSETLGRYGELYVKNPAKYPQYEALAPLYYQEVTTSTTARPEARRMARAAQPQGDTIVVRGTRNPDDAVPVVETLDVAFSLTGLEGEVWVSASFTGLNESSTVYDVFVKALGRDYTATRVKGTYIKAVSGPYGTLSEKEYGDDSGWMYRVNGRIPDVYMGACPLHSGDVIQVFYTRDAKQDDPNYSRPSGGNSSGNGSSSGNSPSDSNSSGSKTEPASQRTVKVEASGNTYTITLPENSKGPQLVTIPNVNQGQLVVIVHADGQKEIVKKSILEDGRAKFLLEQNATVMVEDYSNPFIDVNSSTWYASAVDFAAGRGLFAGVSQNTFAPDLPLTRGMLTTVLFRLEGARPQMAQSRFPDVADGAWYAQGIIWAAENDIVGGYTDGRFGPNDKITREQLAVMLFRYAQLLNISTGGRDDLTGFADSASVSPWARDAVSWAVDSGIISGLPNGTLAPTDTATRAEAAFMLQNFVKNILK